MSRSEDLYELNIVQNLPEVGDLLVAAPLLDDGVFEHSVVMMVEKGDDGSDLGLVLNQRSIYTLDEIFTDMGILMKVPVYCGGPVGLNKLFYIHTLGELFPGSLEIKDGLYMNGDLKQIVEYINAGYPVEGCIRFFVGYSGWSPEQLEREIGEESWAVVKPESGYGKLLNGQGAKYWRSMLNNLDERFLKWKSIPNYPDLN